MDLYLNDWSFSCSGKLNEQWEVITRFGDLVRTLRNKGIDKIIFPANYKNINLGNLQWSECYYYTNELKDKGFSEDQCKELIRHGVPSIHFYSVGAVESIKQVAKVIY